VPFLPLKNTLYDNDIFYVVGVMLYPDNEKLRYEWYLTKYYSFLDDSTEDKKKDIPTPLIALNTLRTMPSQKEIEKRSNKNLKHGGIAGDILLNIYTCHYLKIEEPGVNKAIHCLLRAYGEKESENKSRGVPINEKSFRSAWTKFKSVSHLWAAARLLWKGNEKNQLYFSTKIDKLIEFLAASETFRIFGENNIDKRTKQPTLNVEMWETPDWLALPSAELNISVKNRAWWDKAIKEYIAGKTEYN